jgi:hypothetical protein
MTMPVIQTHRLLQRRNPFPQAPNAQFDPHLTEHPDHFDGAKETTSAVHQTARETP